MRLLLASAAAVLLALSASVGDAAQRGVSGGGLSFDCSAGRAPDGQCVCTPPRTSEDCKGMEQYCDGEITCGWAVSYCWCNQKSIFNRAILGGKVIDRAGGTRSPGLRVQPQNLR